MLIILLWLKKLRPIVKLPNLKLMIESELLSIRIFLVKVTLKVGQKKYFLLILFWEIILGQLELTQQTFVSMKTYWGRLEDDFRLCLQKMSIYEYIRLTQTPSQSIFKTSLRRLYSSWSYVFKISSRYLQDVLKTLSGRLKNIFKTCLQNVLKTSCKNVFKTSCKDVFNRCQDVSLS